MITAKERRPIIGKPLGQENGLKFLCHTDDNQERAEKSEPACNGSTELASQHQGSMQDGPSLVLQHRAIKPTTKDILTHFSSNLSSFFTLWIRSILYLLCSDQWQLKQIRDRRHVCCLKHERLGTKLRWWRFGRGVGEEEILAGGGPVLLEALSVLMLCALSNRRRPFSCHTKTSDRVFSYLSIFSWNKSA